MIFGIIAKPNLKNFDRIKSSLTNFLKKRNSSALIESNLSNADYDSKIYVTRKTLVKKSDVLVVFGGDGTLLHIAEEAAINKKPVIGINLGTLGFLTEGSISKLNSILKEFFENKLVPDKRQLLNARIYKKNKLVSKTNFLNDAVINKGALAKIINLDLFVDDILVSNLRADGIILSSPTGSTAYSLSAGGPIVIPSLPLVIITPICPHTLTNRPLVISNNSNIKIRIKTKGSPVFLTFDGNSSLEIENDYDVQVSRSPLKLTLLRSTKTKYFDILKDKLMWSNNYEGE
ncbi:MAG: NAD(+)/NADH kinase [Thermodesulfobacteriota bacterium]|nr:MAG: NAD(+)/NADH kinase [Candidatus Dadabacteria bacterium]